jgi:hypothetical protein
MDYFGNPPVRCSCCERYKELYQFNKTEVGLWICIQCIISLGLELFDYEKEKIKAKAKAKED